MRENPFFKSLHVQSQNFSCGSCSSNLLQTEEKFSLQGRVPLVNSDFHFDVMCAAPLPVGSFIYLLDTEQLPQSLLFLLLLLLCKITCRFMIGFEYVSECT